jgi:hypothetical protein
MMTITNIRWADADHGAIVALVDGREVCIPADPLNRHYAAIIEQGLEIAEPI